MWVRLMSSPCYGGLVDRIRHRIVQPVLSFLDRVQIATRPCVPLYGLKASDRTQSQTLVRAPSAIISTLHMSNDIRRQNPSVQYPYTQYRASHSPRDHSTMYGLCYEEHPRSANGRLDHTSGNCISTAPVSSSFGPHTEHGQRSQRSASSVLTSKSTSMNIASGRRHESNPRFASYDRRSVGQLSNDREGLEGSKRNRDSVSSRNDYNLNFDGRQRMDTAVPEPQRDSTRQRRLASSDTITAAGQAVISSYTSTYKSKTGAAFTGSAPIIAEAGEGCTNPR